jgi:phage internal scaffolding protein
MNIQKAFRIDQEIKPTIVCGEGLTEQAHKRECDMNHILRDYQRTGLIRHAAKNKGRYDDVSAVDFQSAMDTVTQAKKMFDELPANIRKRFANNPAAFLEFVGSPENKDEMIKLGIIQGNDGLDRTGKPVESPKADPPSKQDHEVS